MCTIYSLTHLCTRYSLTHLCTLYSLTHLCTHYCSPWTDKYDTAELNRYSEPVRSFLSSRLSQLKTEALVYNKDDYSTIESRKPQPQCCEQQKRKGIIADSLLQRDELVMEYKVSVPGDGMACGVLVLFFFVARNRAKLRSSMLYSRILRLAASRYGNTSLLSAFLWPLCFWGSSVCSLPQAMSVCVPLRQDI